jgi:hypothetical protein
MSSLRCVYFNHVKIVRAALLNSMYYANMSERMPQNVTTFSHAKCSFVLWYLQAGETQAQDSDSLCHRPSCWSSSSQNKRVIDFRGKINCTEQSCAALCCFKQVPQRHTFCGIITLNHPEPNSSLHEVWNLLPLPLTRMLLLYSY